jgi:hypothetical protein
MRNVIFLLGLTCASPAWAGGTNFAWNQCLPEGGSERSTFECSSNSGFDVAVASFMLDAPQAEFIGLEVFIDVATTPATLPNWWQCFNPGTCRQTALAMDLDFDSSPNEHCLDVWSGLTGGGVAAYATSPTFDLAPNAARILIGAAMAFGQPLEANQEYYGFKLRISHASSTGPDACAGCTAGACLRLREVRAVEADGTSQILTSPITNNVIVWQCGTPTIDANNVLKCEGPENCTTPAHRTSWGQIKSLYR